MDIRAIVFDMDGVMFDTERLAVEGWKHAGAALGYEVSTEMVTQTFGFDRESTKKAWLDRLDQDQEKVDAMYAMRIAYQRDYIEKQGVPVKKGLRALLDYLCREGYPVTIASSSDEQKIRGYLEGAGLSEYFGEIVGGNRIRRSKPHPDVYQLACEVLGEKPEHCMALEDSAAGIQSAYAAGLIPVMIPDIVKEPPGEIKKMVYRKLNSLEEVIGLLQENKKESQR